MNVDDFEDADSAIKMLDAQKRIVDVKVSAFPHLKKEEAESFNKGLYKLAYPETETEKWLSVEQFKELGFGRC